MTDFKHHWEVDADGYPTSRSLRSIDDVLTHHARTVRVVHRLKPFAVAMAGAGVFGPFKD